MEPLSLIGSIIGAGGSIFGSILGADAQEEAAKQNAIANMLNYFSRENERRDRINAANKSQQRAFEGATDASGNRTRYIPGKGWVVELSESGSELNDLQNQVQRRSAIDQGTKRDAMYRNIQRQLEEGDVADSLLRQLQESDVDPEAIRRSMLGNAMRGVNNNYDELTSAAMRKAIRTGSSNTGDIIADIGKQRSKDLSNLYSEIPMKARSMAATLEGQQKGNLANLYNMFAQRASNVPGFSYAPQNVQGQANNMLSSFSQMGQNADNQLISAFGQRGGTLDYVEPNMGWANAASIAGQSIGNIFESQSAFKQKSDAYDNLMKRFGKSDGAF